MKYAKDTFIPRKPYYCHYAKDWKEVPQRNPIYIFPTNALGNDIRGSQFNVFKMCFLASPGDCVLRRSNHDIQGYVMRKVASENWMRSAANREAAAAYLFIKRPFPVWIQNFDEIINDDDVTLSYCWCSCYRTGGVFNLRVDAPRQ